MEQLKLKIVGTSPLLMHNDTLVNPLSSETKAQKALTSKRKKVDEDHLAIAKNEFIAGCYWDEKVGFHIPGACLDATFLAGARLSKLGVHWLRGALVFEDKAKLLHEGPDTPEELWKDTRFVDVRGVRVDRSKIMRYRPIFLSWAAELTVAINTDVLNISEAQKAITDSGLLIGVCDFRPRFGRFGVSYVR